MELLDGGTLRRRVAEGPLPQERVLDYGVQIADALDYAHSLGIVHRDIKTANIFVNERGRIKVLDFGLAKLVQPRGGADPFSDTTMAAPGEQGPTGTGQAMGTLSCMSPEQARGDDVDARTDLFSLGIVLYEMATGHEAFAGKTPALMYDAILHQTPARPSVAQSEDLAGARSDHRQGAREGPDAALSERGGAARRPEAASARYGPIAPAIGPSARPRTLSAARRAARERRRSHAAVEAPPVDCGRRRAAGRAGWRRPDVLVDAHVAGGRDRFHRRPAVCDERARRPTAIT